ncbi:DUF58 domain-containing protein [Sessilibacter corallicola]|uniref:DUF58 domain-containing protein n=1 Tax=Sessilibacter corallicola TaxID=2904075 RepID=A0ABQ0AAE5_9GAMM|nr:DUF58 domain-containing protein [Sessilibacter corallicola]MCE2029079.1 DUF58 domain-containing protein [Sessilibacter corallicola]
MSLNEELAPRGAYSKLQDLLKTRFLVSNLTLKITRPSAGVINGPLRTQFKGRGMEFEEVRIYQPGDDIRTIDWRVTARTQVPYTKLFKEERERPVVLIVDQRANMFFGSRTCFKSVYATHLAAMLGWMALNQNDRIGALIFGDEKQCDVRPRRGKHAQMELVHRLIEFNEQLTSPVASDKQQSLEQMVMEAHRIAKPGTSVLIISDFHDFTDECEKQLALMCRHCDVNLFHVFDQLETQLPEEELMISDGKKRLKLSGHNKSFNQTFREQFQEKENKLQSFANKRLIPLIIANTLNEPSNLIRAIYGKGKTNASKKKKKS